MKVPTCPSPDMNLECCHVLVTFVNNVNNALPRYDKAVVVTDEEREAPSDSEDNEAGHHGQLPANLVTEPAKQEAAQQHACHVDSLGQALLPAVITYHLVVFYSARPGSLVLHLLSNRHLYN